MTEDPTHYTESNALLAIIEGDTDTARQLVVTAMLPGERRALARQAQALTDLCEQVDREYRAAHGGCTAVRDCTCPSVGYFYMGRNKREPYGVCARHCGGVIAEGFTVHEMPEVKL
jgi:hypothetical protein